MRGLHKLNVVEQCVFINKREINFKGKIEAVAISTDKIFIVIDMSSKEQIEEQNNLIKKYNLNIVCQSYKNNDMFNNVYCYDYDGNLLWQIQSSEFKEFNKNYRSPIVGVDYDEEKDELYVNDFMTMRYRVDMKTGKRLDFVLTK